jgi:hypothetical protein
MTRLVPRVTVLVLCGAVLGCASATPPSGSPAPSAATIPVSDVKSLNGKWAGYITGPTSGSPLPSEWIINDGTFTARTGASSSTGPVTISDGKITGLRTGGSGTGGGTLTSAWTAVLQDRGGKRVLVGQGRNDFGPYSFELTEQK